LFGRKFYLKLLNVPFCFNYFPYFNQKSEKMFSINIPVFNVKVAGLVNQLIEQGEKLGVPYEIRIYDDGSEKDIKEKNRQLESILHVVYVELNENHGRAAIRNKMGFESKFDLLLFIDADSELVSENYLKDYLTSHSRGSVICGGTAYKKRKPKNTGKLLRWVYGTRREAVNAEVRNNKKGFIITSNNFLIEKNVFHEIHFRKNLKKYGHEDTLLSYDLFKAGKIFFHIDNPVKHTGLEDSKIFLEKTRLALKNLNFIVSELVKNEADFINQVYFLNRYKRLTSFLPPFFLRVCFRLFRSSLEKNLLGPRPSLFVFDLYKLLFYSTIK